MTSAVRCTGAPTLASLLPLEVFFFTSLAVFTFFLFFAFFVYRRGRPPLAGKLLGVAFFLLCLYVASTLLFAEIQSKDIYLLVGRVGWIGVCLAVAFWLHMTVVLRTEARSLRRAGTMSPTQWVAVASAYVVGGIFFVYGSLLPDSMSKWLFDTTAIEAASWPYCLWLTYEVPVGPYYFLFGLYFLACVIYSLGQVASAAADAARAAAAAESPTETQAALALRAKYYWMFLAAILLATSGLVTIMSVDGSWQMPEVVGQTVLALAGLIVGLAVSRQGLFVADKEVISEFYRAAASITVLVFAVVTVFYASEGGQINMSTLLGLSTLSVLFVANMQKWYRLIDSLTLGPKIAEERATIRSALYEPFADHQLLRAQIVFQRWSSETRRIFLHLGAGLNRRTIAEAENMHISTVDFHIRKIKDSLETSKLEEIRELAHDMHMKMRSAPAAGSPETQPESIT